MNRKLQPFFVIMILAFVMVSCRASESNIYTSTPSTTRPATTQSIIAHSTATVNRVIALNSVFPSFLLTDPNAACVGHYSADGLSCLDATGWHTYVDGIPRRISRCTDGSIILVDDGFYQYQIDEGTLSSIGGWVDQGVVLCGNKNNIWVSDYSEVMNFDGSIWASYPVEKYFESDDGSIYSMAVAPNGSAWVTTDKAIAVFDGADWEVLTLPSDYHFIESDVSSHQLVIDSSGVVWVSACIESCGSDVLLLKYDGVEWSSFPGPDDDIHGIHTIVVDKEDRIWIATSGTKIFMLNQDTSQWELRFDVEKLGLGNEWESRFNGEHLGLGFGDVNRINQMEFDGQGRLWVTTDYGLGIFDGVNWTIYHDYTANLYANEISALYILGDGPQLPSLIQKSFGSIRGKLVSEANTPFKDDLVELCIMLITGRSICADQAVSESVYEDGSFEILDIPPGVYSLRFKISDEWYYLVSKDNPSFSSYLSSPTLEIHVKEGEVTQLGVIPAP